MIVAIAGWVFSSLVLHTTGVFLFYFCKFFVSVLIELKCEDDEYPLKASFLFLAFLGFFKAVA